MTITLTTQEVNLIIGGIIAGVIGIVFMLVVNWSMGRKWHKPRGEKK